MGDTDRQGHRGHGQTGGKIQGQIRAAVAKQRR